MSMITTLFRNRWAMSAMGLCVCILAGCNTPMTVRYTPVAAVPTIRSENLPDLDVAVLRFLDNRKNPEAIGSNKNVYGMRVNTVKTTDNLGQILSEASVDALRKAGLDSELRTELTSADSLLSEYGAVVGGEIVKIVVDTKPGWNTVDATAEIEIMLTVWRNGEKTSVGPVLGSAKQGTVGADITNAASQALDGAIQNCIRNMIIELKQKGVFM